MGFIWLAFLFISLYRTAGNEKYKEDHDFSETMYKKLNNNLPEPAYLNGKTKKDRKSSPFKIDINNLLVEKTGYGGLLNIEDQYIKQLNNRKNKFDANGGLYYFSEENLNGGLAIQLNLNRYYFKLRSPFRETKPWKGVMVAGNDSIQPTVSALGHQFRVSLRQKIGAKYISLSDTEHELSMVKAVVLRKTPSGDKLGELIRQADTLIFEPGLPLIHNDWQIYLNGKRCYKSGSRILKRGDLIVFIDRDDDFRRNLMYLGYQKPILSYVQWRNGEMKRMFPQGQEFSMAYSLGLTADMAKDYNKNLTNEIQTSLNLQLHAELADDIESVVRQNRYRNRYNKNIHYSNRIALTILDAYSGQILAIPQYPTVDPNEEDFSERIQKATYSHQRDLLLNHNLKNHAVGSTIKPLIFASIASQFNDSLDIANLEIHDYTRYSNGKYFHGDEIHQKLGSLNLCDEFNCQRIGGVEWVSPKLFLTKSKDHYEAVLGLLGLIIDVRELKNVLIPYKKPYDIRIGGINYNLDLLEVEGDHSITTENDCPIIRTEIAKDALIFKGIVDNFQVYNDGVIDSLYEIRSLSFLPSFSLQDSLMKKNPYLSFSTPEPVILYPNRMTLISDRFIQFLLGAADAGRWNNITMSESFARLITGKKINSTMELTLTNLDTTKRTQVLASPLWDSDWMNTNLLNYLEGVPRTGGTLSELTALSNELRRNGFKLICKTGTINERTGIPIESETLFFALGRWDELSKRFVEGKTLVGFMYLENVRNAGAGFQAKADFAIPIINTLAKSDYFVSSGSSINPSDTLSVYKPSTLGPYKTTELTKVIDASHPITRDYAVRLASTSPGSFNVGQVCAIFNETYSNWKYVNDPKGGDYFSEASRSINLGLAGDCDDFAIVMAAAIRAIGGETRVIFAYNSKEESGHAYAEVAIPSEWGSENNVKKKIVDYYKRKGKKLRNNDIHIKREKGKLWLNLDWWSVHVGGPYYVADTITIAG